MNNIMKLVFLEPLDLLKVLFNFIVKIIFILAMIRKLFVYEAMSLVLSSAILGSLVGIALAMLIGFIFFSIF